MDECLIWNSAWIPVAAKPFTIFAGSLAICIQTERNNRKNLEWLIVHPVSAINSPVFFSHFDFIGAKINVNINSIRAIVSCVDKYNTTSEISPVKWLKPVRWLNQCYLVFSCCSDGENRGNQKSGFGVWLLQCFFKKTSVYHIRTRPFNRDSICNM